MPGFNPRFSSRTDREFQLTPVFAISFIVCTLTSGFFARDGEPELAVATGVVAFVSLLAAAFCGVSNAIRR